MSVLVLYGIDKRTSAPSNEEVLKAKITNCEGVVDIYVVPDYTKAYCKKCQIEENKEALLRYTLQPEKPDLTRANRHNRFSGRIIDEEKYYNEEITNLNEEYDQACQEAQKSSCGQCFVFYNTLHGCRRRIVELSRTGVVSILGEVRVAPIPE